MVMPMQLRACRRWLSYRGDELTKMTMPACQIIIAHVEQVIYRRRWFRRQLKRASNYACEKCTAFRLCRDVAVGHIAVHHQHVIDMNATSLINRRFQDNIATSRFEQPQNISASSHASSPSTASWGLTRASTILESAENKRFH